MRPARRADVELIASYQEAMALETEERELDAATVRAGVAGVFDDPARGRYLIAERAGVPVGALLLTTEWSDWRAGTFWWFQSVFVEAAHRGAGVFRALYRSVAAEARATPGVVGLRLYVEAENANAQRVYAALGMAPTSYRLFEAELE